MFKASNVLSASTVFFIRRISLLRCDQWRKSYSIFRRQCPQCLTALHKLVKCASNGLRSVNRRGIFASNCNWNVRNCDSIRNDQYRITVLCTVCRFLWLVYWWKMVRSQWGYSNRKSYVNSSNRFSKFLLSFTERSFDTIEMRGDRCAAAGRYCRTRLNK